jgi:catechol 2,3-dioxygenase-like lactoylglutathione lyase family enzyme
MLYMRDGMNFNDEKGNLVNALTGVFAARQSHLAVKGIDHINLSVKNLQRSMEFYEQVFGFRLIEDGRDRPGAPYVILSAHGRAYLALHESRNTAKPEHPFTNHWGFVVGNIERARRFLNARHVRMQTNDDPEGDIREWPKSRSVYVYDPDGHEIELVEHWGGGLGA